MIIKVIWHHFGWGSANDNEDNITYEDDFVRESGYNFRSKFLELCESCKLKLLNLY